MATLLPSLSSDEEEDKEDQKLEDDDEMDDGFEFGGILGEDGGLFDVAASTGWSYQTALNKIQQQIDSRTGAAAVLPRLNVADLIEAKRKAIKKNSGKADEDNDSQDDSGRSSSSDSETDEEEEKDLEDDVLKTRAGNEDDDDDAVRAANSSEDDEEEGRKAAAYFDTSANPDDQSINNNQIQMFSQFAVSRPILRGIAAIGFVQPTPIQASVIPLALAGRDICASAVTGSGKTAAFLLPILERLLHRSSTSSEIKAVILTPTRELAAQCLAMMSTLGQFTQLSSCLITGGSKNVQAQATELNRRPDIVIATPGRLLDHVTNSAGVSLHRVDFMVLDEADRLLDLGFEEQVHELVKQCNPEQRQTMLFSATLNTKVDDLVKLSLKRPVRVQIRVDNNTRGGKDLEVAPRLEQEFVRVRSNNNNNVSDSSNENNREGILLALLTRTFTKETIVFFDTKAAAHRLAILCGLLGIKCTELHGNLTQQQRLQALDDFTARRVDVLLATDLAARGLDIDSVKTVINFEMPAQMETYIHRIGRTARAGRGGLACTLIGEGRRHMMKELIRNSNNAKHNKTTKTVNSLGTGVIRSRTIPPPVVTHFVEKIASLEPHITEILQAEAVARMDRIAEMEVIKAQNIIEHSDEIHSRPKREWFETETSKRLTKQEAKEKQQKIADMVGTGTHRMTRKKRRAREALQALHDAPVEQDPDAVSGDDGISQSQTTVASLKASARQTKRLNETKKKSAFDSTTAQGNDYFESQQQPKKKKKKEKKTGGVVGSDAAGDSSLFSEDKVAFAGKERQERSSKQETLAKSTFRFKEFDPTKALGKKRGAKSFKSKSKYKRRK